MRISMYQTRDSVNNALYVKAILEHPHVQLPSGGKCLGLYVNQLCKKEGSDKTLQSEPSQNACAFSIVNSFELIIKICACLIKRVCKY